MDFNTYLDKLEENINTVSCEIDKSKTLCSFLKEILLDNTTFKIQDAQNISSILSDQISKISMQLSDIENSIQNKRLSLK